MKIKFGIVVGVGILTSGVYFAVSQQAPLNNPAAGAQNSLGRGLANGPRPLNINLETWEVSSPDYSVEQLAELNTVERRLERAKSAQSILQPIKSGPRPGQAFDEIKQEELAAFAITHPGLVAAQQPPTPEQAKALERAMQSILKPQAAR